MFEIDWGKLLIIGVVAAIVIAPNVWEEVDRWLSKVRRSWS